MYQNTFSPGSSSAFLYAALQTVALKQILWGKGKRRNESEDNSRKKHPVLNVTNIFKTRLCSRQEIQVSTQNCVLL